MNKKIVKVYDYLDAAGQLVFQVVRFEPKSFAQRRPYNRAFAWGLKCGWYQQNKDTMNYNQISTCSHDPKDPPHENAVWIDPLEPILYRIPQIIEAIKNSQTIFICEGEKDADNLASWGYTTTTCAMGSGKWKPSYTEFLKGAKDIILIPDKDEAGHNHRETVAQALSSSDIKIRIITLSDKNEKFIKDISEWIEAGGTKPEFEELINSSPHWQPSANKDTASENEPFKNLIHKYGHPYYLDKNGNLISINESFWAGLHFQEHTEIYEPDEKLFYRYASDSGLYKPVSEDIVKQEISARMLEVSRQNDILGLEKKRTNSNLSNIVQHLKGISEKRGCFSHKQYNYVHAANGIILLKDTEADFVDFSPSFYSRNKSPIPFDPSARCDRFLNDFFYPAISSKEDAILIQKYIGLCLLGDNRLQRFLILDGKPGRGKSTLALIIQKLVGLNNVTELRTKHLDERFELYRYLKKTLLVGVDVPGDFLSQKSSYRLKGLVGGDWLDTEKKHGTDSFQIQGNYCIIITSNSRLRIRFDGDIGAWARRLLIVRFEGPPPVKKIPHLDDLLIKQEGSGLLNFGLTGLDLILKDISNFGDIQISNEQTDIITSLLSESDSLRRFLENCVSNDKNGDLSVHEIVEAYAHYCALMGWNAKPHTVLYKELEGLMLEMFHVTKSNSVQRFGQDTRGFRNVRINQIGS